VKSDRSAIVGDVRHCGGWSELPQADGLRIFTVFSRTFTISHVKLAQLSVDDRHFVIR